MSKYNSDNERFVWVIGSIREVYPDIPEQVGENGDLVLWDRETGKAVTTVASEYANAMCLETVHPKCYPFTALAEWFNELSDETLASEGLPVNAKGGQ